MPSEVPLRVAAVTCNLLLGGSATFLVNFQRALDPEQARLRIICTMARNEHAADFAAENAEVVTGELGHLIYEDRLAWTYRAVAAGQPAAVLACLGAESYEMLRLAPPGVARIGLIQSHDPLPYEMARRYAPWVDAMVGVSPEIAAHLQTLPEFAARRVESIPYGIHFQARAARAARPEGEPLRVLYLGRLIETQKRISRVVELARRLAAGPERITFTLAGTGPEEDYVRAALAGVAGVRLAGLVPNQEVPALLREHDAYVLLSDFEGLPLSLLEAMGEGVVPVVSDLPTGMAAAVGEAGVLLPVGDVAAAEAALRALARDRSRLAALAHAAQKRAHDMYSAKRMVGQYVELVRSILHGREVGAWPAETKIPAPLGVRGWLYSGFPRRVRRVMKSVLK